MYKESRLFTPIVCVLMGLCAVLTGVTFFFDYTLFLICASVTLVAFAALLFLMRRLGKRSSGILRQIAEGVRYAGDGSFMDAPVPVIAVYDGTEIIWYNSLCAEDVFAGIDMRGEAISHVLPQVDVTATSPPEGYAITFQDKMYTAYVSVAEKAGAELAIIYMVDDSQLKYFAEEYHLSRPSVAIAVIDNYDEMVQEYKETERAQLVSQIENALETYFSENEGFIVRTERDKFIAIVEERGIRKIATAKFNILDQVRAINIKGRMGATLSIGVGRDAETLHESEAMARQALDMCLGRGGDQVAVKTQNGYEFFGGVSQGIEKRTKVKTRIIASALHELIEPAENVIIMGHRYADLDCLGSSVGMLRAVRSMDKPSFICLNREKNLVHPLLNRLIGNGYTGEDFKQPEEALEHVTSDTLLIVLDTHVPHMLESEALYRACKSVVVIDHHRKLVSYIDNAVIFYHEPFASSASEMVTELLQYLPSRPQISKLEAEALLSGITLDTKNFITRTGVRTFEAAAYLRRVGADTMEVRRLFSSSIESYQQKVALVANAQIYRGCAIAASDEKFEGLNVTAAPQAADELLTISEVEASFVIHHLGTSINVSARSMGAINVQVIMEKLGGGGHQTMAAAQFPGDTVDHVKERVTQAIDEYYDSLTEPVA